MYIDPVTVVSPKAKWELERVIINTGEGGWSAALGRWDGDPVLALRWNGDGEKGVGTPQSRGFPTWFIVPKEIESVLLRKFEQMNQKKVIVSCDIYRPDEYADGCWKVEASLPPMIIDSLCDFPITFSLPNLPNRFCCSDKGYIYVDTQNKELRGQFVDGKWCGHMYSNGVVESDNPTGVDAFKENFILNVVQSLEMLMPIMGSPRQQKSNNEI